MTKTKTKKMSLAGKSIKPKKEKPTPPTMAELLAAAFKRRVLQLRNHLPADPSLIPWWSTLYNHEKAKLLAAAAKDPSS